MVRLYVPDIQCLVVPTGGMANMLIGIVCELVANVAAMEKDTRTIAQVKEKVLQVLRRIDSDSDGKISRDEFIKLVDEEECLAALTEVGVDVVGLMDLLDIIFKRGDEKTKEENTEDGITFTFDEFIETVYGLRGSNRASVKDIVDLRMFIHQGFARLEGRVSELSADSTKATQARNAVQGCPLEVTQSLEARLGRLDDRVQRILQLLEGHTVETRAKTHPACTQGAPGFLGFDGSAMGSVTSPHQTSGDVLGSRGGVSRGNFLLDLASTVHRRASRARGCEGSTRGTPCSKAAWLRRAPAAGLDPNGVSAISWPGVVLSPFCSTGGAKAARGKTKPQRKRKTLVRSNLVLLASKHQRCRAVCCVIPVTRSPPPLNSARTVRPAASFPMFARGHHLTALRTRQVRSYSFLYSRVLCFSLGIDLP
ncbi:unnamed protein product [Prorocentrum cordatum]|uniref:EF-hand domain-containing protein n=1 Tax=Prorocentrum cordatum TaxID=2364126 RepID=A0ABN9T3D3_9DINO|nr:unnamed protein product [Polarella glacialis]